MGPSHPVRRDKRVPPFLYRPQVCSLLRSPDSGSRAQQPEVESPPFDQPWDKLSVEEAQAPAQRTVSMRYLNSLKNKLSTESWRKSCQPGTSPKAGPQVPPCVCMWNWGAPCLPPMTCVLPARGQKLVSLTEAVGPSDSTSALVLGSSQRSSVGRDERDHRALD